MSPSAIREPKIATTKICHRCHQHREKVMTCTIKSRQKRRSLTTCGRNFCDRCLKRTFKIDAESIRIAGVPANTDTEDHLLTGSYIFECPVCQKICGCASCNKPRHSIESCSTTSKTEHGVVASMKTTTSTSPPQAMPVNSIEESMVTRGTTATTVGPPSPTEEQLTQQLRLHFATLLQNKPSANPSLSKKKAVVVDAFKATGSRVSKNVPKKRTAHGQTTMDSFVKRKSVQNQSTTGQSSDKENDFAMSMDVDQAPHQPKADSKKEATEPKQATKRTKFPGPAPVGPLSNAPVVDVADVPRQQFFTRALPRKPTPVDPPYFEYIRIDYPLSIIWGRLLVREFIIRFENILPKQLSRYINTVNDPNSTWTGSTYKSIFLTLLKVLNEQNYFKDNNQFEQQIRELNKSYADSPELWSLFHGMINGREPEDIALFGEEQPRLELLNKLCYVLLDTELFRSELKRAEQERRPREKTNSEELKNIRARWVEKQRILYSKKTLINDKLQSAAWKNDYEVEYAFTLREIKRLQENYWFQSRKSDIRSNHFLGRDVKGNSYHLFTQHTRSIEDWGRWIVVLRNETLPHPSGIIPSSPEIGHGEFKDTRVEVMDTEAFPEKPMWYAFDDPTLARHLADWIKYCWNDLVYEREIAKQREKALPVTKNLIESVTVPMSPRTKKYMEKNPEEAKQWVKANTIDIDLQDFKVKEQEIHKLVCEIRKTADFWEFYLQEGKDGRKLPA